MENQEKYVRIQKPDSEKCPRSFCFCWSGPKSLLISGADLSAQVTEEGAVSGYDGRCRCPFGVCTRLNAEEGTGDYYESHGPHLREAELPWFYFFPKPKTVSRFKREKYIEESEKLWGEKHWVEIEEH